MTQEEKLHIEERIVEVLKTVYDPEIPVDIYSLRLIYNADSSRMPCRRLHHGGCTTETRHPRRGESLKHKSCVRTGMGQEHDERGGTSGTGL